MKRHQEAGFTLLEVLVAITIMGVAVVTMITSLSTSVRNGSKLTDHDRAVMVARERMNVLLMDAKLPHQVPIEGRFDERSGWSAVVKPYDIPPVKNLGTPVLERIQLTIWWTSPGGRQTFALEGFRRGALTEVDMATLQ